MRARRHCLPLTVVVALFLTLASCFVFAGEARSDESASVTYDACHVEAYLMPDGNLSVVERWTVTYLGEWYGVEWKIDTAHSTATNVAVVGAGEVVAGDMVAYDHAPGDSGGPGTYRTKGDFRCRTCTLSFDKSNETVELYVAYRLRGAAQRWRDASVLDWRFLDTQAGAGVGNVTLDLYLERPADGGVWPGENVFAWSTLGRDTREEDDIEDVVVDAWPMAGVAQGTHAARVQVDCGDPDGGDFAQVHVLFPEGWLMDAGRKTEPRRSETFHNMDELVRETQGRGRGKASAAGLGRLVGVVCAMATAIAWVGYRRRSSDRARRR